MSEAFIHQVLFKGPDAPVRGAVTDVTVIDGDFWIACTCGHGVRLFDSTVLSVPSLYFFGLCPN